jgi:hypothetical protein
MQWHNLQVEPAQATHPRCMALAMHVHYWLAECHAQRPADACRRLVVPLGVDRCRVEFDNITHRAAGRTADQA